MLDHFGWPWEVKGQGHNRADGDWHAGIYASPDNSRTCFYVCKCSFEPRYLLFIVFLQQKHTNEI